MLLVAVRILSALAVLVCACSPIFADVQVRSSSSEECAWTYTPGAPLVQREDTVNPQGVFIEWPDAGVRVCRDVLQPVRVFWIAMPPGTEPHLKISGVESAARPGGLPGRPEQAAPKFDAPSSNWAELSGTEIWRDFRLARVEVYLQRGSTSRSEVLESVELTVSFVGAPSRLAARGRDAALLASIALNGSIADRWWHETPARSRLDDEGAWPEFDLYRLAVTETGLYSLSGSSVVAAALLGKPTAWIKVFGNGGRLLPSNPGTTVDTVLKENAVHVEDQDGDGIFDAEDRVLFFGRGLKGADYCDGTYMSGAAHQSPFSTENMYFVGVDSAGSDGLRMEPITSSGTPSEISVVSAREYLDQDLFIYATGGQSESGVIWFMSTLNPYQTRSYAMNLEGATGTAAQLTIALASGGVNLELYVGGMFIDTVYFPSGIVTVSIPAGVLVPGTNNVQVHNASSQTVYLNYFEVRYDRTVSAPAGALEFFGPQGRTGLFRYAIEGLSTTGYLLDVTNPLVPRLALGNVLVDSSFASSPRRYYAVSPGRVATPVFRGVKAPVALDYTRLRDPSNAAGLLILTFDEGYSVLDSLKTFHETYREEPLPTVRVRMSDVFDEFGWGVRDVVATRNFCEYAYRNWHGPDGTDTLKYVLFVGDGDYDYRNIESSSDANWMPPWESGSECRDDFFVIFPGGSTLPWLATGRWPVQSTSELQTVVSKTIAYATQPLYGPWKNTATFAADDERKGAGCGGGETLHTTQAESLIRTVLPPYFTFKKVYEILYPFRSTSTGTTKPDATRDLIESINRGTLLVNYAGHGNERIWSDEQLFVMDRDRNLLDNSRMWPLFLAATCSWGAFDRPMGRCFPEILLTDPHDGGIACVAATRFTYITSNNAFTDAFYHELFLPGLASRRSFGQALLIAKAAQAANAELYHVFGDPVLRLATPEYFARVTAQDDSLQALSLFHLSGEVSRTAGGPRWADFQGVVEARVFDTEDSAAYYWCGNTQQAPFYYGLPGNAIFRGTATVTDGTFDVTFRVPRDVRYGGSNAKVSLYFYGKSDSEPDSADGIGIREHLLIASAASTERDTVPPTISGWLEVPSFRSGDLVSSTPRLNVSLADSSGINLSGEVGHKITARIDDAQTEDLTPFFNYDLDRHTTGTLEKVIGPLAEGEHRLVVEAWDSFNNLSQTSLSFTVGQEGEAGYAIRDVYCYPNPMQDATCFTYFLTQEGTQRVSLKVYTLSGKLVHEMDGLGTRGPAFNSNADRPWDGRDREGHMLANGVYLYRVKAEHEDGHDAEATGKLVILR